MAHEVVTTSLLGGDAAAIRAVIPMAELQEFFGPAFLELTEAIRESGANPAGPPFVRYYSMSPEEVDLEAVMVCDKPIKQHGRVHPIELAPARAAVVRHVGRYDKMKPVYDAITHWMQVNGKRPSEAPREVYVTTAAEVSDPSQWVTLVEQPVA